MSDKKSPADDQILQQILTTVIEMKSEQQEMKREQQEMKREQQEMKKEQQEMKKEQQEMKREQQEMKREQQEMKREQQGMKKEQQGTNHRLDRLEKNQEILMNDVSEIKDVQYIQGEQLKQGFSHISRLIAGQEAMQESIERGKRKREYAA